MTRIRNFREFHAKFVSHLLVGGGYVMLQQSNRRRLIPAPFDARHDDTIRYERMV